jgi:DNA-binding PadR family transcriptional regulator
MYGYQIKQSIFLFSDEKIEIKEGSLYGPLYRLEKKGMITSKKILVGAKRFRVYYHITELGLDFLNCATNVFNDIYSGASQIINGSK